VYEISAATREGVGRLVSAAAGRLARLPPTEIYEPEYTPPPASAGDPKDLDISSSDGVWFIEGKWMDRLVRNVNFSDYESRMFFERTLRGAGVYDRLERMGIREGDSVSIYNLEFEYIK
jgi:GTP-binding protein